MERRSRTQASGVNAILESMKCSVCLYMRKVKCFRRGWRGLEITDRSVCVRERHVDLLCWVSMTTNSIVVMNIQAFFFFRDWPVKLRQFRMESHVFVEFTIYLWESLPLSIPHMTDDLRMDGSWTFLQTLKLYITLFEMIFHNSVLVSHYFIIFHRDTGQE